MKKSQSISKIAVIIFVTMLFTSCNKDKVKNTCNVSNPVEDLSWLKEAIDKLKLSNSEYSQASYYKIATFKKETVFYFESCHALANYALVLRDCNGDQVSSKNYSRDDLKNSEILWKHPDSPCDFE